MEFANLNIINVLERKKKLAKWKVVASIKSNV